MRRRIDVVAEHGSTALSNALEHNSLFLMPVWRTLGKSKWVVSARVLPKTIAITAVVLGAFLSLFLIPSEFQLHGKGTLEPIDKRDIFAGVEDATVISVPVKAGQEVKKGQTLIELQSTKLGGEIAQIMAERQANEEQIRTNMRFALDPALPIDQKAHVEGELATARAKQTRFNKQLQLLEEKKQKLIITSPIDGRVVTWQQELDRLKNRPVERGQRLMQVADPTTQWELEVRMPEDRMGHIKRAQKQLGPELNVDFQVRSDPGHTLQGKVKEIEEAAHVEGEEGNTVLVRVAINRDDLPEEIRPGAEVSAKIDCGRRSLGYCWFHDVIEFIQTKILFKW